jgi:pimeloyl-ACP methyl ester carboxylesterase
VLTGQHTLFLAIKLLFYFERKIRDARYLEVCKCQQNVDDDRDLQMKRPPKFFISMFAGGLLATPTSSHAESVGSKPAFVFVHGAFFDGSGFAATEALLQKRGYRAIHVDLPGRKGQSGSPAEQSLETYRQAVMAKIKDVPGKLILVGHSFGGIVVSDVAEAIPDRVTEINYLAALLPRDGEALTDLLPQDKTNKMTPTSFQPDPKSATASIAREDRVRLFCADCTPATKKGFPDIVLAEPLAPLGQKVRLTARFAAIPKAYIYTRNDAILSYPFQQAMVARTPVRETIALETGHVPFLSAPAKLADALIAAID